MAATPYYSYDRALLEETLRQALKASSLVRKAHIHYAIKANSNPQILRIIADSGMAADCVSGGEMTLALRSGFKAEGIYYAGVGKSDDEIRFALRSGIGCFNVESIEELSIINAIAQEEGLVASVALRINPDIEAHTHTNIATGRAENKFGINLEKFDKAVTDVLSSPYLNLAGLHFHIGSQILDMGDFEQLCHRINALQDRLLKGGIHVGCINVGGGLGIDYEYPELHPVPDFKAYFETFAKYLRLDEDQEFHCELGRSIVAQCGSLITRCILVKEGSVKRFVIVDAGMNDLIRPALYGAKHKIENISAPGGEQQLYDVVGPICETTDSFAQDILLSHTRRGDLLAIRSAGAYGESMSSTYNSRPLPQSVIE